MGDNDRQQNRREIRRKRRVRNQIIAYGVLTVLVLAAAFGVAIGIKYLLPDGEEKQQEEQENKEKISDILAEEAG